MPSPVYREEKPRIIPVRTSERLDFKDCRQKWYWGWVDCLRPKKSSGALILGDLVHQALAEFYPPGIRRGPKPAETFQQLALKEYKRLGKLRVYVDDNEYEDLMELGTAMLENYFNHYGRDARYKIIAPEQAFQVDVMHPKTGRYWFTYVGKTDGIAEDRETGRCVLLEHKTSQNNDVKTPLALDEQAGSYWAFMPSWLESKGISKTIDYILYNFLRKAKPDTRPTNSLGQALNQDGSISKKQPAPYFRREMVYRSDGDRANLMRRVMNELREMEMVKAGKLAVYKNPAEHCRWCPYRDMCEVHETGSDWEAMRDSMYLIGEPYMDHEEELLRG